MLWYYPLIRAFVFFAAGIALGRYSGLQPSFFLGVALFSLVLMLVSRPWSDLATWFRRGLFGLGFTVFFAALGALRYDQFIHPVAQDHIVNQATVGAEMTLAGIVYEDPKPRSNSTSVLVQLRKVHSNDQAADIQGLVQVIVYKNIIDSLKAGDGLVFAGTWTGLRPPQNPGAFDYASFLQNRGISGTFFAGSRAAPAAALNGHGLWYSAARWRQRGLDRMRAAHLNPELRPMAEALVLGYKRDLDAGLMDRFSMTGVIHVLAVSGLHVGLVLLGVQFVLGLVPWPKTLRWIPVVAAVAVVWAYALLTGLSPSVTRAATMFSFLAIGRSLSRHIPSLHGLWASAFVLLLIKPGLLFEVGFQLSYAAVAGILMLEPVFSSLLIPKKAGFLAKRVGGMTSVTLAAQLATFPLGLFYFGRFPLFFIPANLLVLPLLPFVLGAGFGLVLLPTEWLTWVPLDRLLNGLLFAVVAVVDFFDGLDPHITQELHVSLGLMALTYLILWLLYLALARGRVRMLYPAAALMLLWGGIRMWPQAPSLAILYARNQRVVVYEAKGERLIWSATPLSETDRAYVLKPYEQLQGRKVHVIESTGLGVAKGPWGTLRLRPEGVYLEKGTSQFFWADGLPHEKVAEQPLADAEKRGYACTAVYKSGGVVLPMSNATIFKP